MANILIKQGKEIAGSSLVTPSTKADKTDLSSIIQTGTASSQAISSGTYFYLNDVLVKAKVDIANGATFTLNTNYEVITAGALNELNTAIDAMPKQITGVASNDTTAIINWLNTNNSSIPLGLSYINFSYGIGMCYKQSGALGRLRLLSYYASLDNKSSQLASGTWGTFV